MAQDDARSELEARVYSRAGAAEPRVERLDPVTGRTIVVTESEWLLLQADRAAAAAASAGSASGDSVAPDADAPAFGPPDGGARGEPAESLRRRRIRSVEAALIGLVVGAGLVAGWLFVGWAAGRAPAVDVTITPSPTASEMLADETLYSAAALEVFRDPARDPGSLPSWLRDVFPDSRVARLVPADGPMPGVSVYAATTDYTTACLIVRLDANGMVWNCRNVDDVLERGMTLHASIPANLGSADADGDGISGDASRTDVLTVEWHVDGTFVVSRRPQ